LNKKIKNEDLNQILSKGADDRIYLNENGLTKYGVPLTGKDFVTRGSCTCNPTSKEDIQLINELLNELHSDQDWIKQQEKITITLKSIINIEKEDAFEIVYTPSGTDIVYLPLLLAQLLKPDQEIHNIFTCFEEIGSGTKLASEAKFYSSYNQFGNKIVKTKKLDQNINVKSIFLNARTSDGDIINPEIEIKKWVSENPQALIIINLVYGSKSGIEDNLSLIDKINAPNIIWTTDLCQFRHSKEILNILLKKNCLLFITGSKFYQSPPFCGALLMSQSIFSKIMKVSNWNPISNFGQIFSKHDFPQSMKDKTGFPDFLNKSRILRWSCAVKEIERFNKFDKNIIDHKINLWRKTIVEALLNHGDVFELMPHQEQSNKTILSFRIMYDGKYLDHNQLKELFLKIVKSDYRLTNTFSNITIGQPVAYGKKSFLRLAIGSKNIRQFVTEDEHYFQTDKEIVQIIISKLKESKDENKRIKNT